MPKGSPQLTAARREEILSACERIYEGRSFSEILLKDIADETSFTRTSIYNYFQSKEEIFLALLEREFRSWSDDLEAILSQASLSRSALADRLAKTLEPRKLMLKIYALNLYDLAENSREEKLVEFNVAYGWSRMVMQDIIRRFLPSLTRDERNDAIDAIYGSLCGIWPSIYYTEKQLLAMKRAGVALRTRSIYQVAYASILRLLQ